MNGALYWSKVGGLEIGTYLDAEGKPMLCMRGQCSVSQIESVLTVARAVVISVNHDPNIASEQRRTGGLFL